MEEITQATSSAPGLTAAVLPSPSLPDGPMVNSRPDILSITLSAWCPWSEAESAGQLRMTNELFR